MLTETNLPDPTPQTTDSTSASSEVTSQGVVVSEVVEEEITKFFNTDSAVRETVVLNPQPYSRPYISATVEDFKKHTIQNFLERFMLLARADWTTAEPGIATENYYPDFVEANRLISIDLPQNIIAGGQDSSHNVYEKVNGFAFMRSGMNVAVMVNAQKFQVGRLIIWAVPYPNNLPVRMSMQQTTPTGLTQLPHTFIDLQGSPKLVHFYLPHIGPYVQYDIPAALPTLWQINVGVFNQLQDPSGNTVTVSMWGNLDHPDFKVPTCTPAGAAPAGYRNFVKSEKCENAFRFKGSEAPQMAGGSMIGQGVALVGSLASAVLPEAAPLIGMVSQVAQGALGSKQLNGASKPEDYAPSTRIVIDNNPNFPNVDGTSTSTSLGVMTVNSAPTQPGVFGTSKDEMSIQSIVTRPAFINYFHWDNAQSEETVLFSNDITPSFYIIGTPPEAGNPIIQCTPYSYIASGFMKWRGSMVYSFSAVKSQFHSGRLEIIWIPNKKVDTAAQDFTKAVRVIWDLTESNSISIVCPYVAQNAYKSLMSTTDYVVNNTPYTDDHVSGYFLIRVFNRLQVASANVSNTIIINVSASMGPDADFAVPRRPNLVPYSVQSGFVEKKKTPFKLCGSPLKPPPLKGVSLGVARYHQIEDGEISDILNNPVRYNPIVPSSCYGEAVISLRSLMKRKQQIYYTAQGSDGAPVTVNTVTIVAPNFTVMNGDDQAQDVSPDWIAFAQNLFAFRKGGISLHVRPTVRAIKAASAIAQSQYVSAPFFDVKFVVDLHTTFSSSNLNSAAHPIVHSPVINYNPALTAVDIPINTGLQGWIRLDIPYYSQYPCLFNEISLAIDNAYFNQVYVEAAQQPIGWVIISMPQDIEWTGALDFFRAARDDMDMGFFIGAPMCTIAQYPGSPIFQEPPKPEITKPEIIPEFKLDQNLKEKFDDISLCEKESINEWISSSEQKAAPHMAIVRSMLSSIAPLP